MIGDLNGVYKEGCSLVTTCDNFSDEETAEQWLYDFLLATNCFSLFRQQPGVPIYRHADQQWHDVRCDILAIPAPKCGIDLGAIVFEVKRSGEKIGGPLNQMLDYLRTVFPVRNQIGIIPTIAFLFPCEKQHGPVASIMQNQHMGTAARSYKRGLVCFSGEQKLLEFDSSGNLTFATTMRSGKKMGAR